MITSPSRPRRLLVAAGLVATALAVVRDHDLLALRDLERVIRHPGAVEPPAAPSTPSPTQQLAAALQEHDAAWSRMREAFDPWVEAQPDGVQITGPDHPAWRSYWTRRAELWPDFAASLERLSATAMALRADAPDNGAFEVVAGLADVLRAVSPGEHDPLYYFVEDEDAYAALTRVEDPALLAQGLARVDAGLTRPTFDFGHEAELGARLARLDGAPIDRMSARLAASSNVPLTELMFLKGGARQLVRLARAERLAGRTGEPLLARARRLALRQGSEATWIIELLVANAELSLVHEAWLREAAVRGDADRTQAVAAEQVDLRRLRDRAAQLPEGFALDRLGVVDTIMMPPGGWKGAAHDPALGRATDHAVLESLVLLALLVVGVFGLAIAWVRSRGQPAGGAPPAGWTLGDTLAVVLPSFGAVAVLTLLHTRLHPSRALGLASAGAVQAALLQSAVLVSLAPFVFAWLLRRRVLARHGLTFSRPNWALAGLGLALAGAHVALLWVAGPDQALLPVGLGLVLAGALTAWRGGALGRPSADPTLSRAVRGYEGRVALASLGVALALVAAIECALVAPRRDALWRAYDVQLTGLLEREAETWGHGEARAWLRELLAEAPDAPRLPG